LARVGELSEAAQQVLRAMSASRGPLPHHVLAALVPSPEAAVREALEHHVIVRTPGGAYAFRHALTREAIYATLLAPERERLHRALAETIEPTTPEALADRAHHFYGAGDRQ